MYNVITEVSHKPMSLQPSSAVLQVQSILVVPRLYSAQTIVSVKGFQGIRRYRRQSPSVCGATDQLAPRPPFLRFLYNTHTHTHRAELLWTSDQLVAEAANYTTNTREQYPCPSLLGWPKCIGTGQGSKPLIHSFNIHALSGIRTRNPSNRAVANLRLRQHGLRDRPQYNIWVST
jgi:hypothetical protein